MTGHIVCDAQKKEELKVVAQLNWINNMEKIVKRFQNEYLKDLEIFIKHCYKDESAMLLCYNENDYFKEQDMVNFYTKKDISNLYQYANWLAINELLGTFQTGKKHIYHIMDSNIVVEALILANIIHEHNIISSDHKSIIISLDLWILLNIRIIQYMGSFPIKRH